VVDKVRELSGAEGAALCLLSPTGNELTIQARSGSAEIFRESGKGLDRVPIADPSAEARAAALKVFQPGRVQASLTAPLHRKETVVGVLVVGAATPREFSTDDRALVNGLATQAAIPIENARLYDEVQGLAMQEERPRLAQELHDGLTQTLGLLHLKLHQLQGIVAGPVPAVAATAIQEITGIAESAYEEARRSIFDLRTMDSRRLGLLPLLTEYVDGFRSQSGIAVAVETDMASPIDLPPTAEVHQVRIVQEALSNVRRHAGARRAWVRVRRVDEWPQVTAEDDGWGWDPTSPPRADRPHFGLQTMRERAESLGGTPDIEKAPGRGTRVTARVPAGEHA
jgi:signal transduction histidine kinase